MSDGAVVRGPDRWWTQERVEELRAAVAEWDPSLKVSDHGVIYDEHDGFGPEARPPSDEEVERSRRELAHPRTPEVRLNDRLVDLVVPALDVILELRDQGEPIPLRVYLSAFACGERLGAWAPPDDGWLERMEQAARLQYGARLPRRRPGESRLQRLARYAVAADPLIWP